MTINVLIVDDSPIVRTRLRRELDKTTDIRVVATAEDPYAARDQIKTHTVDVILLDMEMPRMDGLTFLRKLMAARPIPTIIVSSLTPRGCDLAIACLEAGAVAVLPKPGGGYTIDQLSRDLVRGIRAAAGAKVERVATPTPAPTRSTPSAPPSPPRAGKASTEKVIVIGTSTGGTDALKRVLQPLPEEIPGILVVQHMPPLFTRSFAERLDSLCALSVKEAEHGDTLRPGQVLIAPGDYHLKLAGQPGAYHVQVVKGPKVCGHRPSVEVLFKSTAQTAGNHALGIIMTGMGDDGANALGEMRGRGAFTLAQDEESCVVYGMPGEAVKRGSVCEVLPLGDIPQRIQAFAQGRLRRQAS